MKKIIAWLLVLTLTAAVSIDTPAVKDAEGNVITEAVPGYLTYKAAPEKTVTGQ